MLTPENTYIALLVVQALHLLHHRLTKRHISFAEVTSALVFMRATLGCAFGVAPDGLSSQSDRCADIGWKPPYPDAANYLHNGQTEMRAHQEPRRKRSPGWHA